MKHILIATDLSERSNRALRRALSLARESGAKPIVLHVVDDDKPQTLIDAAADGARQLLSNLLHQSGQDELTETPKVVAAVGDPFRVIVDEASRLDADLIVMGSHRKRLLGDIFTGTTVERVMRLGGRPVLMVNRDDSSSYTKMLAAVDLSDASAHALRAAQTLGLLDQSRAAVVHGFLPAGEALMYYAGVEPGGIEAHVETSAQHARAAVAEFLDREGFGGLSETILIEKGSALEAIEAGLHQIQPDLLIIGTRGHGGLKRVLLGSVADAALRQFDCDILAVPPASDALK